MVLLYNVGYLAPVECKKWTCFIKFFSFQPIDDFDTKIYFKAVKLACDSL